MTGPALLASLRRITGSLARALTNRWVVLLASRYAVACHRHTAQAACVHRSASRCMKAGARLYAYACRCAPTMTHATALQPWPSRCLCGLGHGHPLVGCPCLRPFRRTLRHSWLLGAPAAKTVSPHVHLEDEPCGPRRCASGGRAAVTAGGSGGCSPLSALNPNGRSTRQPRRLAHGLTARQQDESSSLTAAGIKPLTASAQTLREFKIMRVVRPMRRAQAR